MQRKAMLVFFVSFVSLITHSISAQVIAKKSGFGESEAFFLNELSAIISEKDGTIKVEHAMPNDQRPEGNRDIDFKQGDEILMVNAQHVKSLKELKEIYDELEVGGTMRLGVRRGEEMFIVSFNKIDPEKLPKRKLLIRKGDLRDAKPGEDSKVFSEQIKIVNKDGKVKPLLELGLILQEVDSKVKVDKVIADLSKKTVDFDAKEGDIITSMNGKKILTIQQFSESYDKIETGSDVKLVLLREKKEIEMSFKKPKAENVMIIQDN